VDLESLEQLETRRNLAIGSPIRKRPLRSCKAEHAGAHELIDAINVGERTIPAVVDVEVQIQVIGPDAQTDMRGCE
jgi:hypothetical protein